MSQKGILVAHRKSIKKSYKHLTIKEKRIMKIIEAKEQAEKYLYGFNGIYKRAKRLSNGQVDWSCFTNAEIDIFHTSEKAIEKYNKIDEKIILEVKYKFNKSQFNYSQSF